MFERSGSNWLRTAKLVPLNPLTLKEFGRSVAIVGNYALVGDPGDYDTAPGGGAAYLFRRNGLSWTMVEPKIVASDVAGSDWFGQSVALSGTDILVGAPNATDTEIHQGIAYVYPIPVHMEPQKEFSIYARILFGLIMGGPGVILLPGSGPVPVDPEPYRRAWTALSAPERDLFVGLALGEVASLIHDADVRQQVKEAGLDLTRSAARRLSKART
jgi:hypothetical protein